LAQTFFVYKQFFSTLWLQAKDVRSFTRSYLLHQQAGFENPKVCAAKLNTMTVLIEVPPALESVLRSLQAGSSLEPSLLLELDKHMAKSYHDGTAVKKGIPPRVLHALSRHVCKLRSSEDEDDHGRLLGECCTHVEAQSQYKLIKHTAHQLVCTFSIRYTVHVVISLLL
jgi:hypothetical protein